MDKDEWLTPPWLIEAVGPFDLDPCAPINPPWRIAAKHYTIEDNGLAQPWAGLVWLNPPYGRKTPDWLARLADHPEGGIALIFARTETDTWRRLVWERAEVIKFINGRLHFHHVDGSRAAANAGAPSALIGYGKEGARRVYESSIPGSTLWEWGVS